MIKVIERHPDYLIDDSGVILSTKTNKILKQQTDYEGYKTIRLDKKTLKVHRLVLLTFIGPCPTGRECCHINGIRDDNRLSNLRWGTRQENNKDTVRHGHHNTRGERNPNHKLTEIQVKQIIYLGKKGVTKSELSKLYNVSRTNIGDILERRTWKDVEISI